MEEMVLKQPSPSRLANNEVINKKCTTVFVVIRVYGLNANQTNNTYVIWWSV
jgi:hypothetical protein